MNGGKVLTAEFMIAVAFVSYGAIKKKYLPWPPSLIKLGIAFAILGILSMANEEVAATLGGGFLLAAFLKEYQANSGLAKYRGGVPTITQTHYIPLNFGADWGKDA